jgi:hypothetical protein
MVLCGASIEFNSEGHEMKTTTLDYYQDAINAVAKNISSTDDLGVGVRRVLTDGWLRVASTDDKAKALQLGTGGGNWAMYLGWFITKENEPGHTEQLLDAIWPWIEDMTIEELDIAIGKVNAEVKAADIAFKNYMSR